MASLSSSLPVPANAPFVMPDGRTIERYWYLLLVSLFDRTGGASGVDLTTVQAEAAAAVAASSAAVAAATAAGLAAATALAGANASLKIAQNLSDLANAATARANLGLGTVSLGNTQAGWVAPTGTPDRTTFNADATTAVSNPPTQAEVQNITTRLLLVQQHLAALEIDALAAKVIGV